MITPRQFLEMQQRTEKARTEHGHHPGELPGYCAECKRETGPGGLREQILKFCYDQWPRWKVISARPDVKSTLPLGAPDMVVAALGGRTFHVELKAKDGKLTKEQNEWAKELSLLGHEMHVVRSLPEFVALTLPGQGQSQKG